MGIIPQADPDKNIKKKKNKRNMSKRKLGREETKLKRKRKKERQTEKYSSRNRSRAGERSRKKVSNSSKQNSEWHQRLARFDHCTTTYCKNTHLFILILGFVLSWSIRLSTFPQELELAQLLPLNRYVSSLFDYISQIFSSF